MTLMKRLICSTVPAAAVVAVGVLASAAFAANDASDWEGRVGEALGKPGAEMPGDVYRVALPRTDLMVTANGVEIKPGFALGGWLAFKKTGENEAMVMGDLVLLEAEVNPVMQRLVADGVEITAVHNHLLGAQPNTMYMHVLGHGDPAKLAGVLHGALAMSKTPLSGSAPAAAPPPPAIDLDTAAIDQALGRKGKNNGGIYQVSVPRAEPVKEHGMEVPEAMGSATAINFQPTGAGKAAITGDFVMIAEEVNPVVKALRDNGIEVTALHNHMLEDQPRLFFMHFWANDDATKLAKGLKAALDQMKVAKS
jgi:biotin operon repressor